MNVKQSHSSGYKFLRCNGGENASWRSSVDLEKNRSKRCYPTLIILWRLDQKGDKISPLPTVNRHNGIRQSGLKFYCQASRKLIGTEISIIQTLV